MRAKQRLQREEREALVLRYFAEHPDATFREAAADLKMNLASVHTDFKNGTQGVSDRSREAYIGVIVNRNERLIGAQMQMALVGETRAAQTIVVLQDQILKIFGLFAPTKNESTINLSVAAQQIADQFGLDAGDVIAEAERIVAAGGS